MFLISYKEKVKYLKIENVCKLTCEAVTLTDVMCFFTLELPIHITGEPFLFKLEMLDF